MKKIERLPLVEYMVFASLVMRRHTVVEIVEASEGYLSHSWTNHVLAKGVEEEDVKQTGVITGGKGRPPHTYSLTRKGRTKLKRHINKMRKVLG